MIGNLKKSLAIGFLRLPAGERLRGRTTAEGFVALILPPQRVNHILLSDQKNLFLFLRYGRSETPGAMKTKPTRLIRILLPAILTGLALLYVFFVVVPPLYFHHLQPPFLADAGFCRAYFRFPGGLAELTAHFLMQSFCNRYLGTLVLCGTSLAAGGLVVLLTGMVCRDCPVRYLACIPAFLVLVLPNHYNFPFQTVVSLILVLVFLLLTARITRDPAGRMFWFTAGAVGVYYFCGSGFMLLFSACALFLPAGGKTGVRLVTAAWIPLFAWGFPLVVYQFLFPLAPGEKYLFFFRPRIYYMAYEPSLLFYLFLLSVPLLLALAVFFRRFGEKGVKEGKDFLSGHCAGWLAALALLPVGWLLHRSVYQSDARKMVACDYYGSLGDAARILKLASGMREYSFSVNLNYNLALSKAGGLTEGLFDFFQASGAESLHPDNEFLPERAFIAAEFYYHLGYISEARHWAYEAQVYHPYSIRALRLMTKIHLVTGEYKAAARCLELLGKTISGRAFARAFRPYVTDTTKMAGHREFMEKRASIPAEKELSPSIETRFRELLEVNPGNKTAFEFLAMYYLLDAQPGPFLALIGEPGRFCGTLPEVWQEAVLMFEGEAGNDTALMSRVSPSCRSRHADFMRRSAKYPDDAASARRELYPLYGKSYFYYLRYIFPRIVKPEIITDEEAHIPI